MYLRACIHSNANNCSPHTRQRAYAIQGSAHMHKQQRFRAHMLQFAVHAHGMSASAIDVRQHSISTCLHLLILAVHVRRSNVGRDMRAAMAMRS
jgi:branched-subunit amino acid ABC-type transport system permease component